mmetsp:Transcript_39869/g.106916  ORF Transcript_39869/g.106916 Transcript_39869/m.106916 type:complete len:260 (-) Transcript_39869:264-1043(-)
MSSGMGRITMLRICDICDERGHEGSSRVVSWPLAELVIRYVAGLPVDMGQPFRVRKVVHVLPEARRFSFLLVGVAQERLRGRHHEGAVEQGRGHLWLRRLRGGVRVRVECWLGARRAHRGGERRDLQGRSGRHLQGRHGRQRGALHECVGGHAEANGCSEVRLGHQGGPGRRRRARQGEGPREGQDGFQCVRQELRGGNLAIDVRVVGDDLPGRPPGLQGCWPPLHGRAGLGVLGRGLLPRQMPSSPRSGPCRRLLRHQ